MYDGENHMVLGNDVYMYDPDLSKVNGVLLVASSIDNMPQWHDCNVNIIDSDGDTVYFEATIEALAAVTCDDWMKECYVTDDDAETALLDTAKGIDAEADVEVVRWWY